MLFGVEGIALSHPHYTQPALTESLQEKSSRETCGNIQILLRAWVDSCYATSRLASRENLFGGPQPGAHGGVDGAPVAGHVGVFAGKEQGVGDGVCHLP